jgi:hypothetical protein
MRPTWKRTSLPVAKTSVHCSVTAASTAHTKARHMTWAREKRSSSSSPKSTPPRGDPNATATPADAAADKMRRFWALFRELWPMYIAFRYRLTLIAPETRYKVEKYGGNAAANVHQWSLPTWFSSRRMRNRTHQPLYRGIVRSLLLEPGRRL